MIRAVCWFLETALNLSFLAALGYVLVVATIKAVGTV
jgi:hypothetical protein